MAKSVPAIFLDRDGTINVDHGYVHEIDNGVAFGCGMPDFNSNLHGANEHACVKDLMTSAMIFAQCIVEICGE